MKVLSSLFFKQLDASILHKLLERKATRFFHRLLQPMFMKQDICSVYFQTQFKSGSNVPEPADHQSVCKSLSPGWSKHLLGLCAALQWGGKVFFWVGEGLLRCGLREGEGDELLQ